MGLNKINPDLGYKYLATGQLDAGAHVKSQYNMNTGDERPLPETGSGFFHLRSNYVVQVNFSANNKIKIFIPEVNLDESEEKFTPDWWNMDWEKTYSNLYNQVIGTNLELECDLQ